MKIGRKVTNTELLLLLLGAVYLLAVYVPVLTGDTSPGRVTITTALSAQLPGAEEETAVDVNTADAAALQALPGVGPVLAERIVAWREANGPFTALEDLLKVEGIGQSTLDKLLGSITLGQQTP